MPGPVVACPGLVGVAGRIGDVIAGGLDVRDLAGAARASAAAPRRGGVAGAVRASAAAPRRGDVGPPAESGPGLGGLGVDPPAPDHRSALADAEVQLAAARADRGFVRDPGGRRASVPPAQAANAVPRVPPPAAGSGRTLIVRAVVPGQEIGSVPEANGFVNLKAAPLEPTDFRFPINLATALRLSDARPLIVAAAQASVWVAEAQLTRARVLWVPTLMTGVDYIRHDGGGPDFNKGIMTAPSVNFFYGGTGMWQMPST